MLVRWFQRLFGLCVLAERDRVLDERFAIAQHRVGAMSSGIRSLRDARHCELRLVEELGWL